MFTWQNIIFQPTVFFGQGTDRLEFWRLGVSLAIVVLGLIILEICLQLFRRRLDASLKSKGIESEQWKIRGFLPPLRLAATALILRLVEPVLLPSKNLTASMHAMESLLMIVAALVLIYLFVEFLDRLRLAMPDQLQDQFPEKALNKMKSALRVTALVVTIAVFIYSQRNLFPARYLQYSIWRYLLFIVVIVLIFLAIRQIGSFLTRMTIVLRTSEQSVRSRLILEAAIWPVRLFLITLAGYAAKAAGLLPISIHRTVDMAVDVLGTLAVVIFVYRLIELLVFELSKYAQREDNLLDQNFVHLMRMIAKITVITIGAIYLIRAISGKPLSALLAGLGIGGLAVALAAQDTLKNFFGSIVIMLDKPFSVGQRITAEGYDGVIEEIGFRSTRVRTLTGHLVTIPNEKLATNSVENIGRRPSIRRLTNITITYDTPPAKVEKALAIIRELLDNHEGMHADFPPRVYFNEFNDASLNIIMIYWYHPPDYWAYLNFTEKVNLQIMRRFEEEGIEFAFPTTTTYLAQDDRRPLHITWANESKDV